MSGLDIVLISLAAYVLLGLVVFFWFHFRGWPDSGQAMPMDACVCTILFPVSFIIYVALFGLWNRLRK